MEVFKRKMKISETIGEEIQRRQLIWYGHVRRMDDQRILRMAMQYKLSCKKVKKKTKKTMV